MSAFFDRIDADLVGILGDLCQTATIRGKSVACGITRPAAGNEPMEGGLWEIYSGTVYTRRSLLAEGIPVEGEKIIVDGETVYVGKVKSDLACPLVTIPFQNTPPPK